MSPCSAGRVPVHQQGYWRGRLRRAWKIIHICQRELLPLQAQEMSNSRNAGSFWWRGQFWWCCMVRIVEPCFFVKSQREGLQQLDGNIDTHGPTPPPRVTVLIRTILPSFQLRSCRFMLAGYEAGQVQPGENTLLSVSPCPYGFCHITYRERYSVRERKKESWEDEKAADADSVWRILNSCTMTDDFGSARDITHSGPVWHVMGGGLLAAWFL